MTDAQLAALFSTQFAVAIGTAKIATGEKVLLPGITDRNVRAEARQITAAATELVNMSLAAFTQLFPQVAPLITSPAGLGAAMDLVDRYVLLPLTYSPRQLTEYITLFRGLQGVTPAFIPADPEDFSAPVTLARALIVLGLRGAALPSTMQPLSGPERESYTRLPAYIIASQKAVLNNNNLVELMQPGNAAPPKDQRDPFIVALMEGDANFQAQLSTVSKIANAVQRILAAHTNFPFPNFPGIKIASVTLPVTVSS